MSTQQLSYIPLDDLTFVPSNERIEAVRNYLHDLSIYCEIEITPKTQFFDMGENFISVSCPKCREELEIEDWQDMIEKTWDGEGFTDVNLEMPCCGAQTAIHRLEYEMPAGFARFGIVMTDYKQEEGNWDEQAIMDAQKEIERLLDHKMLLIIARY